MRDYGRWVMECRLRAQLEEAFGSDNCWFCSQHFHQKIENQELLLIYFIKSGGAKDFGRRFAEAMGEDNRWYCSQFYGREITDPEVLWEYYKEHVNDGRDRGNDALVEAA